MNERNVKKILMLLKLAYHQEIYDGHKVYFFMYCVNSKTKKKNQSCNSKKY